MLTATLIRLLRRADESVAGLLHGAGISFLLRIIAAGGGFIFSIVLARSLGADTVGLYFLALTVITFIAVVSRMGLDQLLMRDTAVNLSKHDWPAILGHARTGVRMVFIVSVALALILVVSAPWLAQYVFAKPELAEPLQWISLALPPLAVAFVYAEMLKSLTHIVQSQLVQVALLPILAILLFLLIGPDQGALSATLAYSLAALAAALTGFFFWKRVTALKGQPLSIPVRTLLKPGLPLMWVQILTQLISWADILILGMYRPAAEVGIYAVASRTVMLTSFITVAVNNVAAPRFAALYHHGDMNGLANMAVRSTRLTLAVATPVLIAFVVAPEWILSFFGNEFSAGATALVVLTLGQFMNVLTGSVSQILIVAGYGITLRNLSAFNALICVILDIALIPIYGMLGAAIATAFGVALLNLLASLAVFRNLGIQVHGLANCRCFTNAR